MAEDAAKVAPHVYKVIFENERVRVLDVTLEAGASTDMHAHPDYLAYILEPGAVRFTAPGGETGELEMHAGMVTWREGEEHATENIGGTTVRAIFVEPK